MAAATTVLLLAEATAHAANSQEFKERYLVLVIALLPVAFGLLRETRRRPPVDRDPRGGRDPARVGAATPLGIRHGNVQDRLSIPLRDQLRTGQTRVWNRVPVDRAYSPERRLLWRSACHTSDDAAAFGDRTRNCRSARGDARRDARRSQDRRSRYVRSCHRRLTWVDGAASGPVTAIETPCAEARPALRSLLEPVDQTGALARHGHADRLVQCSALRDRIGRFAGRCPWRRSLP